MNKKYDEIEIKIQETLAKWRAKQCAMYHMKRNSWLNAIKLTDRREAEFLANPCKVTEERYLTAKRYEHCRCVAMHQ